MRCFLKSDVVYFETIAGILRESIICEATWANECGV